jgi:hypothetical protein
MMLGGRTTLARVRACNARAARIVERPLPNFEAGPAHFGRSEATQHQTIAGDFYPNARRQWHDDDPASKTGTGALIMEPQLHLVPDLSTSHSRATHFKPQEQPRRVLPATQQECRRRARILEHSDSAGVRSVALCSLVGTNRVDAAQFGPDKTRQKRNFESETHKKVARSRQ